MRWRTILLTAAALAVCAGDGWSARPAGGGSVACPDGIHTLEFRTYITGRGGGIRVQGFELETCPEGFQTISFIVDDLNVDPNRDGRIVIAVEPGTTVTYEESQPILEAIGLLRTSAFGGGIGLSGSSGSGPCLSEPTTDLPDYVLLSDLRVLPYLDVCPSP
jgi:hypothetical protein